MPKEITHWMLAQRAAESLPDGSRLKALIAEHRSAYLGGAVLPDTLLHIFRGPFHPTARLLGQRFHDAAGNCYEPLVLAERRFADGVPPAVAATFLGVISHMEADIALHPWVYAATGSGGIGGHYRLETEIDLHFIRKGAAPGERRLESLLSHGAREALLVTAQVLFDPRGELPRQALEKALALHCRFQAMYHQALWKVCVRVLGRLCGSPFREQRQLFYPLRPWKRGIDGESRARWHHPETGELRSESVEELAQQAVQRSAALFGRIEAAGSFGSPLASQRGANLLTGLHGVTKE